VASSEVSGRHIVVFAEEIGWHGRRLKEAFARLGGRVSFLSLSDCRLEWGAGRQGLHLPGRRARMPAGVLVRGIPTGTLEQVILRLDLLHELQARGIPVCNPPRAIERTVDKAMTNILLRRAGLPTPATWICESERQARELCEREWEAGGKVILKPLFGSQGRGLRLLEPGAPLPGEGESEFRGVYYLQRLIEPAGEEARDIRVLVIGGRARAAMLRRNTFWITNRAQGGRCEPLPLEPRLCRLAEAAAQALAVDYAGVDLIAGADQRLCLLEVNGIPAWQGLQRTCSLDIAALLAGHMRARMRTAGTWA